MYPKLFELPIIHLTVWTYGVMMVVGFLTALFLMRKLARKSGENPDHIANVALYTLMAGVIGARIFYVVHHFSQFHGRWISMFAIWQGGLEFIGGVILAIAVVIIYLRRQKLPVRQYLDILAVGLMLGVAFGRVGCFFRGCCYGRPSNIACAIRFPYGSPAHNSQVRPDAARGRDKPYIDLPAEYFVFFSEDGKRWFLADESNKYDAGLKPFDFLTLQQRQLVSGGQYRPLPIHPTQLYSSANAFLLCLVLWAFWRKFGRRRPGIVTALMFIFYGMSRFLLEFIRDDNPFEYAWWILCKGYTVSQNIGIYMAAFGIVLLIIFARTKGQKKMDP